MKDKAARVSIIVGALALGGVGLGIPDPWPLYVKLFFIGSGVAIILDTIFTHHLLDLWHKLFPTKVIQTDDGPFPMPARIKAEQQQASFFFEDTDNLREQFKKQVERLMAELKGGISIQAIGYVQLHEGIHKVYMERRETLPSDLRNKVVTLHRFSMVFNGYLRECKERRKVQPTGTNFRLLW